jgi:hypothetical protein
MLKTAVHPFRLGAFEVVGKLVALRGGVIGGGKLQHDAVLRIGKLQALQERDVGLNEGCGIARADVHTIDFYFR